MKTRLKDKPEVERFAAPTATQAAKTALKVERDTGRYQAGMIRGVSVCARGEALGHGMWCDSEFLDQIVAQGNANPKLIKSRLAHPDVCSDGIGSKLGTLEQFERYGDQVLADQHFYEAAHDAPDGGDIADYVMKLADEDPGNFGLSIVFAHDFDAEKKLLLDHGAKVIADEDGYSYWDLSGFKSPDPLNVKNLPHARIAELRAGDVVDDPAANPTGLFHRPNAMLGQATGLLDFVFGKAQHTPALSAFGAEIAPERVREFVTNYLANSGLSIVKKESSMQTTTQLEEKPADAPEDDPKKIEEKAQGDEEKPEGTEGEEEMGDEEDPKKKDGESQQSATSDLAKFCAAFGHEDGAKYLLEGVSFEAAQTKHISALNQRLKDSEEKLEAFAKSGVEPVGFSAAKDKARDKGNREAGNAHDSTLSNRDKFAASIATSSN